MGLFISRPSAVLSPFVKSYWGMEKHMAAGETHVQRIIPSGLTELTFYLGDLPQSLDSHKSFPAPSMVSGQQKSHFDIRVRGELSLFSVIFQPHVLNLFFQLPAAELLDLTLPLHQLMKDETRELEDRLAEAPAFSDRVKVVERFLLDRLTRSERRQNFSRISHCLGIINQKGGDVEIGQLASEACLSRKQFERTFLHHVGASPKLFLRTVRFQHAIYEKALDTHLSLTELTYRCGYYDQSHMAADFQKLSGMSPRKFFADCDPYSDYFQ